LVAYGWDFVGDDYEESNSTTAVPDPDPMDCDGHGTHVTGIVAAQGKGPYGVIGAAPEATIGMYRVFSCSGGTDNDIVIKGMLRAAADGMNIISLSLSDSGGGFPGDASGTVASRIVSKGIPVTVANGNDGIGLWKAECPGCGIGVTAVGSTDNPATLIRGFDINATINGVPSNKTALYSMGLPPYTKNVTLPLWAPTYNPNDTVSYGCDPSAYSARIPDLTDHIALFRQGNCTFGSKAVPVVAKGAKYVLFYTDRPLYKPNALGATPQLEGAAMVSITDAMQWLNEMAAGKNVTVTVTGETWADTFHDLNNTLSPGYASSYTTWGPDFQAGIKPAFVSPGGNILSTFPRDSGDNSSDPWVYEILSGTSMATPLTAGILALIGKIRGTFDPATLEGLLMTTAQAGPYKYGTTNTPEMLAPVPQQGGGAVQAYTAAHIQTLISPNGLAFNDSDHFVSSKTFTIRNNYKDTVAYSIGHVGALTGYSFLSNSKRLALLNDVEVTGKTASVAFAPATVIMVPAGGNTSVVVTLTPPEGLDPLRLPVYSGYITINGSNGDALSVPYLGIAGSEKNTAVFDTNPAVTYLRNSSNMQKVPAGSSFVLPPQGVNLTDNSTWGVPALSLANGSFFGTPQINIDVIPMDLNAVNTSVVSGVSILGSADSFPMYWQGVFDSTDNYNWTGRMNGDWYAPPGQYKLLIRCLRVYGDNTTAKDWDSVETVPFSISYAPAGDSRGPLPLNPPPSSLLSTTTTSVSTTTSKPATAGEVTVTIIATTTTIISSTIIRTVISSTTMITSSVVP
jgi:hypothetical protein